MASDLQTFSTTAIRPAPYADENPVLVWLAAQVRNPTVRNAVIVVAGSLAMAASGVAAADYLALGMGADEAVQSDAVAT